jgi:hypothetical protein
MKMSRYVVLLTVTAITMVVMPCSAQDAKESGQVASAHTMVRPPTSTRYRIDG